MSGNTDQKKSSLENAKFIVDILSGLAVPIVLAVITIYLSRQHDQDLTAQTTREGLDRKALSDREHQDRNAQLILGVGPYLFDTDQQKVQFGTTVLAFYKDLPAPLVQQLQHLNGSSNPSIAESAGRALAGPSAPASPPTIGNPAPTAVPTTDSGDRWMVYIASGTNGDALKAVADRANALFRSKNLSLTAKVVTPGPLAPTVSGVVVGDNVPFEQARSSREMARQAGFADTYIIRAPGARAASE